MTNGVIYQGRTRDVAVVIASIPSRHEMLMRALESVHEQTIGPVEIRVVIGLPRLQAYAAACEVDARFVTWLDDDDYMLPDHLETLVNGQKETDADVVWTRSVLKNAEDGSELIQGQSVPPEALWHWDYIYNAFIYRTDLVRQIGGFPSARKSAWGAIHFEAMRLGAKFHFVDHDPTLVVTVHGTNVTNKARVFEEDDVSE